MVLTGLMGFLGWRSAEKAAENADWVTHTYAARDAIDATWKQVIDMETGVRGFAVTSDDSFLEFYREGQRALPQDLKLVRQLTADNPAQQQRLERLVAQVNARLEVLSATLETTQRTGVPPKALLVEGKRRMDAVRATVAEMEAEETQLLDRRTKQTGTARRVTKAIISAGSLLGMVLLLLSGVAIGREINLSARLRQQLNSLNADLEQRIAQRTAALRESEGRMAGIIQSAMDSIITVDEEQRIVLFNAAAEKMFRCAANEALGQPLMRFIPQRFHAVHASHVRRFGETGGTGRAMGGMGALWAVRADGQEFQIEAAISQIVTGGNKLFTVILRDVSERRKAEEALTGQAEELARQTDELLRSRKALETQTLMLQSVLDSMAEGLVVADEDGKFVIWNTAAEKIVGLGATNLPSQKWTEHYGLYLADMVTPFPTDQLPMVRAIHGETTTAQMFVRNSQLDEGVWIEASGCALRDKDGAVRGGVVAFRDISQKRADEQKIRQLNEELELRVQQRTAQLEAANKELEAFTYSVSHDLRAPLRHIAGFSGILQEEFGGQLQPEARRYVERIQQGTHRMGLLVDDLLNLARVGRQELRPQVTGLAPIVSAVIADLEPDTEGRKVEWRIGNLPYVEADASLLKQIFQNLLSNALKYTRPRDCAVIEIGQSEVNGQTVVFVRDNGVGFSMKYAGKLFGVFQRLHRAEDFEGTGVGLATVQRIVQKHGGRIWAEAELDKGATFYLTLGPAKDAEFEPQTVIAGEDLR